MRGKELRSNFFFAFPFFFLDSISDASAYAISCCDPCHYLASFSVTYPFYVKLGAVAVSLLREVGAISYYSYSLLDDTPPKDILCIFFMILFSLIMKSCLVPDVAVILCMTPVIFE